MKNIGFIGAFDKSELIINIAKILADMGNKILVIDSTVLQKTRFIVPAINQAKAYITTYENVDFAVGFKSIPELNAYVGSSERQVTNYDFALIDVDTRECFRNFAIEKAKSKFFVTSYDLFSAKRGISIFMGLGEPVQVTKVLYAKESVLNQESYIDSIAEPVPVSWGSKVYMPFESGDATVNIENQYVAKIKFKNLTNAYKDGMIMIIAEILDNERMNDVKRILKDT